MSLHALVEKWRAYSEGLNGTDSVYMGGIRSGYKECADDLEAALAGGGEPVAWMDHMGGVITAAMKAADPGRPYNTPLFTHPAGAVQVDEAMMSRAAWAYGEKTGHVDMSALRAALKATLNPGGSRE